LELLENILDQSKRPNSSEIAGSLTALCDGLQARILFFTDIDVNIDGIVKSDFHHEGHEETRREKYNSFSFVLFVFFVVIKAILVLTKPSILPLNATC
jgi:hypothetical protein